MSIENERPRKTPHLQAVRPLRPEGERPRADPVRARVLAVTSGKGGVGKTNVCANLAISLARSGAKVCLLDADTGLANVNILFGLEPARTLEDFFKGEEQLEALLLEGPEGVRILPAASGIEALADLSPEMTARLLQGLQELEERFDYLLVDTAAGIAESVLSFILSAPETLLVVTPEPTSLTDAYSLVKVLKRHGYAGRLYVLVNQVLTREDGLKIFSRFNDATKSYLHLEMHYLGHVLKDSALASAVLGQRPLLLHDPKAAASRCIEALAEKLRNHPPREVKGFAEFWKRRSRPETRPAAAPSPSPPATEARPPKGPAVVLKTPAEIREREAAGPDLAELGRGLRRCLASGRAHPDAARDLLLDLQSTYEARFQRRLHDPRAILLELLEDAELAADTLKDLHRAVETAHRKRFERPIQEPREALFRLLNEEEISESEMLFLFRTLQQSYQRRFGHSPLDLRGALDTGLRAPGVEAEDFQEALALLQEIHAERFGRPLLPGRFLPEEELAELAGELEAQQDILDRLAGRLSDAGSVLRRRADALRRLADATGDED